MKNKIKKIGVVVMIASMLLALAGCSGINSNTDKKALLVVSFGSSFIENRELSIDATEKVISDAFPDYDFFRAFTSQIIIDVYKDRDKIEIDNVSQAIEKIYDAGYGEVLVVPTLVINGEEKDEMDEALDPFIDKFEKFTVSTPLLSSNDDYMTLINAIVKEAPKTNNKEAVVLMGHGTPHEGNSAYGALDYMFKDEGYEHFYVGTVEGFPDFDTVLRHIKKGNYTKITLMPSMIVAGDHAHNDLAGDEADSWKNLFKAEGYDVDVIMKGLGELPTIQQLFVDHANAALEAE